MLLIKDKFVLLRCLLLHRFSFQSDYPLYLASRISVFAVSVMLLLLGNAGNAKAAAVSRVNTAFQGSVIECICKLPEEMNGMMTVKMPTVAAKSFTTKGERAGYKKFSLKLIECPRRRNIYLRFFGRLAGSLALVALNNGSQESGMAQGLGLGLLQADGTHLPMATDSMSVRTDDEGSVTFELEAFYERLSSPVVAGIANASVEFTILYN